MYIIIFSYKFFIIYCIMAPIATSLNWYFHKDSIKKVMIDNNISWPILMFEFLFSCLLWINSIIAQSRSDFGLEEEVDCV
jgi:hypothetical protein